MLLEAEMTTALIFLIHFGGGSATNVGKFLHTYTRILKYSTADNVDDISSSISLSEMINYGRE